MGIDRRVGVVGLYHSGKTVFLTSLINHLQVHDSDLCPIGRGELKMEAFRELPAGEDFETFDYERYRQSLVERQSWPEKTRAVAEYRCAMKMRRGERAGGDAILSFLDIPGERLADMFMAKRSYEQWSDQILRFLEIRPEYREHAADYIATMNDPTTDWPTLLHAYRTLLARLIFNYKPIVTPSTFIVDRDGGYPSRDDWTIERLAEVRHSGLAANQQFAPINAAARARWPQSAAAFRVNYDAYKLAVLDPIAEWLGNCDVLVVLIDVTTILASGLGMYEGNRELLEHLLRAADPGRGGLATLANWVVKILSLGFAGCPAVEQVVFVATKADKVVRDDRQKMHGLLKTMTQRLTAGFEGLTTTWAVCSAVDSTADCGDGRLEGFPMRAGQSSRGEPETFIPSQLPDDWPDDWPAGRFSFPDVLPIIPPRRDALPRHIGLHQVIDIILQT